MSIKPPSNPLFLYIGRCEMGGIRKKDEKISIPLMKRKGGGDSARVTVGVLIN